MPLLWLALAFLGGIGLASILPLAAGAWVWAAAGLALCIPGLWLARRIPLLPVRLRGGLDACWNSGLAAGQPGLPAVFFWLACAFCLGGGRYQFDHPALDARQVAAYNDQQEIRVISGVLAAPPDQRDGYTNLLVQVQEMRLAGETDFVPLDGLLLARLETSPNWAYGDQVEVRGLLTTPETGELFSYRTYLARKGVYSFMPRATARLISPAEGFSVQGLLYRVQAAALSLCYRLYPDPEASLVAGVLLGADRGLPQHVQEDFKASGIAHIVAISGFNITILAGLFLKLSERAFGRWRGALLAGLGIAAYTLMTGSEASAMRAAWMGGLALLAAQIGRRQDGLNSLGVTAAVMAWFEPDLLWDVGFQLSFASTLGLIVLGGPLSTAANAWLAARFPGAGGSLVSEILSDYVLLTLSAQAMTLPLMIAYFQRVSLVALVTNLFVLPAQPALMVWSGVSVLAGFVFQPLGQGVAYLAWPLARYTILAAALFAQIPGAQAATGGLDGWAVLAFYGLAVGVYLTRLRWLPVAAARLGQIKSLAAPGLVILLLALAALFTWRAAARAPDARLHLTMLDVSAGGNSGEALLIQSPGGRYVLINGGPSLTRLSEALGERLPIAARQLDWLVVAGLDDGQIEPLAGLLPRFPPQQVLWAGETHGSAAARALYTGLQAANIPLQPAASGQTLDLGSGAQLKVLYASPNGAVLLLEWQSFRALLPVGVDEETLQALQGGKILGAVNVLFLPHSGAEADSPPAWVFHLRPQALLLSVSAGDVYGRPDPAVLQTWQGFSLLRTDQHGWVDISTDGQQMWVQVERPEEK